jgi:Bacterial regulatory helix-turn-helix protein, lysR family
MRRRLTRTMTFGNSSTGTLAKLSPQLLTTRGRRTKFTPERLQQIRNLVERGESREGISEILDVTIGSLQVTCSRLGISLRRPKVDNGVRLRRKAITMHSPVDRDGSMLWPSQGNSRSGPAEPAPVANPMMSFQHIRYFLVLCEEQNFTRAAKRCGITQPSLTNAMKRLEDLLGGPLFHRARKPASVTEPTGLALVIKPYFEQAHLAVEAAQHKASKLKVAKHALMVSTQEEW